MKNSKGIWKKAFVLTLVGGLAFWLANFAISRTPIAAEYRAAMSISYYPMLLESLIGGLIIGLWVSYPLLRFFDRIPSKGSNPEISHPKLDCAGHRHDPARRSFKFLRNK